MPSVKTLDIESLGGKTTNARGDRIGKDCDRSALATGSFGSFKSDEVGRLRALERLNIVDSAEESPFESVVELVRQVLRVPICAVSLVDADRQWFKASRGLNVRETSRDISFCNHAIKRVTPFIVSDATRNPVFASNPLVTGSPHIRSYAGIPLRTVEGYNIGTLCAIDVVPREFYTSEMTILANFAKIVVSDIELRQIASTDGLTGALSRMAWLDSAEREMHRSRKNRSALSLMILDVDHFKTINDRFGHPGGDMVLKEIAGCVRQQLRKADWFGRYGGEEFLVALPETTITEAMEIAENIRSAIQAMRLSSINGQVCTISIGVTEFSGNEATLNTAIACADRALFQAKSLGRNRIAAMDMLAKPRANIAA